MELTPEALRSSMGLTFKDPSGLKPAHNDLDGPPAREPHKWKNLTLLDAEAR